MWDFLKNLGDKANQNADGLKAFGSLLGAGAGIWSAVEQGRQAKKQNDLAMKNYNLNMQILKDEALPSPTPNKILNCIKI